MLAWLNRLNRRIWQAGYEAGYAASRDQTRKSSEHSHRWSTDPDYRAKCERRRKCRIIMLKRRMDVIKTEAEWSAMGVLEAERDKLLASEAALTRENQPCG